MPGRVRQFPNALKFSTKVCYIITRYSAMESAAQHILIVAAQSSMIGAYVLPQRTESNNLHLLWLGAFTLGCGLQIKAH